jgi:hypothetical protein
MLTAYFTVRRSLFFVLFFLFVSGCDQTSQNSHDAKAKINYSSEFTVTGVNDYDFLINDTEAGGVINFTSKDMQQCSLSFVLSKFNQGYSVRTDKLGDGDIDLTCLSGSDYFTLNNSGTTYAAMTVAKLDNTANITLSFSLFSIKSKHVLKRENVTLFLNEKQVIAMHKKPSQS